MMSYVILPSTVKTGTQSNPFLKLEVHVITKELLLKTNKLCCKFYISEPG